MSTDVLTELLEGQQKIDGLIEAQSVNLQRLENTLRLMNDHKVSFLSLSTWACMVSMILSLLSNRFRRRSCSSFIAFSSSRRLNTQNLNGDHGAGRLR